MKDFSEDIINRLEDQEPKDDLIYLEVFDTLDKLPDATTNSTFADRTVQKIIQKEASWDRKYWITLILGVAGMLVAALAALFYTFGWRGLMEMQDFAVWVIVLTCMLMIVQVLDAQIVRKKMSAT
ncbi:MAG: hypothetical protein KI790_12020 [Cyclobacteriaceae bacterium]|nr:hypothetical protein [Cyclobacteriaceae bacterium HetDA_MAG_MS6]